MNQDIVCLSTADWDAELWTNKQHLMSRLADRGARVLYVDSLGLRAPGVNSRDARRVIHRLSQWRPFARSVRSGILRDSPIVLPFQGDLPQRVNTWLLRCRIVRNRRRYNILNPVLWTYTPAAIEIFDRDSYSALIYHCVDDLGSYPGVGSAEFRQREERLVAMADICVASSKPLLANLKAMGARRTAYWPNPAEVENFAAGYGKGIRQSSRPLVGFVGAIQEHKIDVELLVKVAELRPGWDIVLVGPIGLGLADSSIGALRWPPNVSLMGTVSRSALPTVVADFDAALIPYRLNDYTRGVFPMKVFEYLAAGLGVVSTPLPSLVGEVEHVKFAATPDATVEAVEEILECENKAEASELRMAYASGFSWESRADQAAALLAEFAPCDAKLQ